MQVDFHVNFQYRPKNAARPQDEPMLDASGNSLDLIYKDAGLLPIIGDHVVFCRAGGREKADGTYESFTQQIEGVVENRLFFHFTQNMVAINIVVTDSNVNSGLLIKE